MSPFCLATQSFIKSKQYSEYYDAFVSIQRGLFNTRDRAEHSRKRKIVSHTFSAKSIGQFEQFIHSNLDEFVKQWDRISSSANGGYARMDALHWFNYIAFDIIGDLAFGAPFGMLEKGKDEAEVRLTPDSPPTFAPAVEVLNRRGEVSKYASHLLEQSESNAHPDTARSAVCRKLSLMRSTFPTRSSPKESRLLRIWLESPQLG